MKTFLSKISSVRNYLFPSLGSVEAQETPTIFPGLIKCKNSYKKKNLGLISAIINILFSFTLFFIFPIFSLAGEATYLYDDLGRLSQVIDENGEVATYTYDPVGNLLSITRSTGGGPAPTITALMPTSGDAGTTVAR